MRCTSHANFPPPVPPCRRRVAGPPVARRICLEIGARGRRRQSAATDDLHLCPAGFLPGEFHSQRDGQELRVVSVPGSAERVPRRFHGHLRVGGNQRRPPGDRRLSDRRAGSGPARHPQRDLGRSVRGRAHRRRDALPQPGPLGGRARTVVYPDRRARAGAQLAVAVVRRDVSRGTGQRSAGPVAPPRRRPQHPR